MGTINHVTPCGDMYIPPSRTNMSLFSIIQLSIMGLVTISCFYELVDINIIRQKYHTFDILTLIDDIIILAGTFYLLYSLFFAASSRNIRIGMILFVIGAVLAMIIIVYEIMEGYTREIWLKIIQFIVLLFLSFILYQQATRL